MTQRRSWLDALAAAAMILFSVPKWAGAERSVEGFHVIAAHWGADPTLARWATGGVELVVALLLIGGLLQPRGTTPLTRVAHALLLATMLGAIYIEAAVRPGAAPGLLALAFALAGAATFRLVQLTPPPKRPLNTGHG